MATNGGGNGMGKLPPGAAEQIIEAAERHLAEQKKAADETAPTEKISPAQQAANTEALKLLLQTRLDEGVTQLRALAKKHDLVWPKGDGGNDGTGGGGG